LHVLILSATMKIIIDIPDSEAVFGMKVLKSLDFIKKTTPMTSSGDKLWDNLSEAADEVQLHKQGKIELKSAKELLNEL